MITLPKTIFLEFDAVDSAQERLLEGEETLVSRAVQRRRRQFTAGRTLARRAMTQAGWPNQTLLADAQRCPIWPAGLSGSISHTDSWCVAAVAPISVVTSLGIDIEEVARVQPNLWKMLFTENEQNVLKELPEKPQQIWSTCLFSIKEAFYKYQFPLTRKMVGFQEVEVEQSSQPDKALIHILKTIDEPFVKGICVPAQYFFDVEKALVWAAVYGRPQ